MTLQSSAPRPNPTLGNDPVASARHLCTVSVGPDEEAELLLPFIEESLGSGDRSVHIVDASAVAMYRDRLQDAGIDTASAMVDGRLDIQSWDETYLRQGSFDPNAMVARIRTLLAETRARGFARSRVIGYMGWASTGVTGADRLIPYEARIQRELRGLPDLVICAYDLSQHDRAAVMEAALNHDGAVIGDVLRPGGGPAATPRERLLAAAAESFHRRGLAATGVDLLIEVADVAKASFYRHFPSKDDLIVAWLRDPRTRWSDDVRDAAVASVPDGDGDAAIIAFFERAAIWLEADGVRGCPYIAVTVEITDPTHPARLVARDHLAEIERWLRERLASSGRADADVLAGDLFVMLIGGMLLSVARGDAAAFRTVAVRVAELLAGDAA